jgi:hypothetical protein
MLMAHPSDETGEFYSYSHVNLQRLATDAPQQGLHGKKNWNKIGERYQQAERGMRL